MGGRWTLPAAGFAFFWLTDIMSFYATTAFADVGSMASSFERAYFITLILSRIAAYTVIIVTRSRSHREGPPPLLAAIGATAAAFIGIALIAGALAYVHSAGITPQVDVVLSKRAGNDTWPFASFVLGTALLGASQGTMGLLWTSKLTLFSYRGSYLYFIATHIGATLLCAVVLLLPPSWFLPATMASLAVANACFVKMPRKAPLPHTVREQARDIVPLLWRGALAVGVFAFVSGFVSSLARQGPIGIDPVSSQSFTLISSCAELAVMAVPALVFHQPLKLETSYRIALPLSALGFLVLPGLIESIPPELAGDLATSGYMITGIVLSCMVSEAAKTARVPSFPLFACSDGFALVCLLAGTLTGFFIAPRLAETSTGTALVGLGCLYLVALAASWLFGRSHAPSRKRHRIGEKRRTSLVIPQPSAERPREEAHPAEAAENTWPPRQLNSLIERYGFSEQERTVLVLLVEGRTMSRIAQELYLSPSAVKYHAKKLYRRFGVHSRGELNDIVARLCHDNPTALFMSGNLASAYDLTTREQEVLSRLVRGFTTTETAEDLSISENTVKTHVKRIYGKLGAHSRQEVIDLVLDGPRPTA